MTPAEAVKKLCELYSPDTAYVEAHWYVGETEPLYTVGWFYVNEPDNKNCSFTHHDGLEAAMKEAEEWVAKGMPILGFDADEFLDDATRKEYRDSIVNVNPNPTTEPPEILPLTTKLTNKELCLWLEDQVQIDPKFEKLLNDNWRDMLA